MGTVVPILFSTRTVLAEHLLGKGSEVLGELWESGRNEWTSAGLRAILGGGRTTFTLDRER